METDLFTLPCNWSCETNVLRGKDLSERTWNLQNIICAHAAPDKLLLDVGCGMGLKLISLAPHFAKIIGVDRDPEILAKAELKFKNLEIENVFFAQDDGYNLSFAPKSFDVITCMISSWSIAELQRVLKDDGILIVEHLGCMDKYDLKKCFKRANSPKLFEQEIMHNVTQQVRELREAFAQYFYQVQITNGFWQTEFSRSAIYQLLAKKAILKNYDPVFDREGVDRAFRELASFYDIDKIVLEQHRLLIIAQGKKELNKIATRPLS